MFTRSLLITATLSLAALTGCQSPSSATAPARAFNTDHDKELSKFFGTKPVDIITIDGHTLRHVTFVGSSGVDSKDFAHFTDWMGNEIAVRIEHIAAIKH